MCIVIYEPILVLFLVGILWVVSYVGDRCIEWMSFRLDRNIYLIIQKKKLFGNRELPVDGIEETSNHIFGYIIRKKYSAE